MPPPVYGRARPAWYDAIRRGIGHLYLRIAGWRIEGTLPDIPQWVSIAAPHTSLWDFPHMMAYGFASGQYISYFMKASMFRWPFGWFFRAMGGIPIDRSQRHNMVRQMAASFKGRERLIVVVPPAGTRARTEYWKTGFYYIALQAQVPIAMGYLDFERKVAGTGPLLWPTGDIEADFEKLREFYEPIRGKHPQLQGPIRPRPRAEGEPDPLEGLQLGPTADQRDSAPRALAP